MVHILQQILHFYLTVTFLFYFQHNRVWMEYQYEADNVAQMNIYWIAVYGLFILLGTFVSSRLMQTVGFSLLRYRQSQSVYVTDPRNGSSHS